MKVRLLAVGQKMPGWVQDGCQEYLKRFQGWLNLQLVEVPPARRFKNDSLADQERYRQQEGESILALLTPGEHVIALEVNGKPWSTPDLAREVDRWGMDGKDVALLIGGPDGLSDAVRQRANQQWSLSSLTLPHPLARLVVVEQLYRACSINRGHPYHRE